MLLDEQIKLNDPGASLYLVKSLAEDGWNGLLRYNEGEVYRLRGEAGDHEKAAEAYAAATAFTDAPPEAWRAHGYALLKARKVDDGRMRPESLPRTESAARKTRDSSATRWLSNGKTNETANSHLRLPLSRSPAACPRTSSSPPTKFTSQANSSS